MMGNKAIIERAVREARAEAFEQAARAVDAKILLTGAAHEIGWNAACKNIAASIRALKGPSNE
jgi:hypothetical protein